MVGAHIDSVLGAPGAHDDGSGNGVSTGDRPRRSAVPARQGAPDRRLRRRGGRPTSAPRPTSTSLPAAEKARFVGEWQMDMVGTPYEPAAKLWALTPDGKSNSWSRTAYTRPRAASGIVGFNNCKLGQSDHQAFFDVGIPSAAVQLAQLPARRRRAASASPAGQHRGRAGVPQAADTHGQRRTRAGCRRCSA